MDKEGKRSMKRERVSLDGQVALFTGVPTPLALAAARQLGNGGMRLVFAGPGVASQPSLQPLLYQFRRSAFCMEADLSDPASVEAVVAAIEAQIGQVEVFIHTLGKAKSEVYDAFSLLGGALTAGDRQVLKRSNAPLLSAMTCSRGALRHMAQRNHGHILHLVARGDVGAFEVEKLVLNRLHEAWERDGAPTGVRMSSIFFEDLTPLVPSANPLALPGSASPYDIEEPRLLDCFTARLAEEEDWIERVLLEREIGNLILKVCVSETAETMQNVEAFDFDNATHTFAPIPANSFGIPVFA